MDKRWILIIIILIIGVSCLFFIVDSSNNIVKATSELKGYIITIPSSMNIETSEGGTLVLVNRNAAEKIVIEISDKGNFTDEIYDRELVKLNNREDVADIQNTTVVIDKDKMPTLFYKDENGTFNQISILYKYKHTFTIKSINYKDNNTLNNDAESIVESLTIDYKQKHD